MTFKRFKFLECNLGWEDIYDLLESFLGVFMN
jgi:hypothetical protein